MKKILAMILAGGRVDELGSLTIYRPKSVVPFGGMYRIIDFPLSNLLHSGITRVGVLGQYHSASLIRHIGNGAAWDFVGRNRGAFFLPPFKGEKNQNWYSGTADAIAQNIYFIKENSPDLVLILSGDHVYKMNYQDLIDFHEVQKADMTAVFKTTKTNHTSRFGQALFEQEDEIGGRIIEYHEKPIKQLSPWVSLTIYLFDTNILLDVLNKTYKENNYHIGKDIIPKMLKNYRVYGYKFKGYWGYTQTVDEYWQTNMDILDKPNELPLRDWQIRTNLEHRNLRDRVPIQIGSHAEISNSLINSGCIINGKVDHSILFSGVEIEKGAEVKDSIVMFDSKIGKNMKINRTIVNTDLNINDNTTIGIGKTTGMKDFLLETIGGIHVVSKMQVD